MCNKKRGGVLPGYAQGPCYTEALGGLQAEFGKSVVSAGRFMEAMNSCPAVTGYVLTPLTSDGQSWRMVVDIKTEDRKMVAILFPWSNDATCRDGTITDQHIAVHIKDGETLIDDVAPDIATFCEQFAGSLVQTATSVAA